MHLQLRRNEIPIIIIITLIIIIIIIIIASAKQIMFSSARVCLLAGLHKT